MQITTKNQQSHVKLCGFQRGMKTKSPKLELTNEQTNTSICKG
jgi:hypothetical protein